MESLVRAFLSAIPFAQKARYLEFLESTGKLVGLSASEVKARLQNLGTKQSTVPDDVTTPDGFNTAQLGLLTDLTALFAEADNLDVARMSMVQLNNQRLKRLEGATAKLESYVDRMTRAKRASFDYTDVRVDTFYTDTLMDTKHSLYVDHPKMEIDNFDHTLRLKILGNLSKTISSSRVPLVYAQIQEVLGISQEKRHPLSEAFDGKLDTYWAEVLHSPVPITADKVLCDWLPVTYRAGAAVMLRLQFDRVTEVTEIQIKPRCKYPLELLQVSWLQDKKTWTEGLFNGYFSVNAPVPENTGSGWWLTAPEFCSCWLNQHDGMTPDEYPYCLSMRMQENVGAPCSAVATGTWDNIITHANRLLHGSDTNPGDQYYLTFWAKRSNNRMQPELHVVWRDSNDAIIRHPGLVTGEIISVDQWDKETDGWGDDDGWYCYRQNVTAPPSASTVQIACFSSLVAGTVHFDNIHMWEAWGRMDFENKASTDAITVALNDADCKELRLVLAQPTPEIKTYAVPKGTKEEYKKWAIAEVSAAVSLGEKLYNAISGHPGAYIELKPMEKESLADDGSLLYQHIRELGGYAHNAAKSLKETAYPPEVVEPISVCEYIIGASEINVLHREYAPSGWYITKPLDFNGEPRKLRMELDIVVPGGELRAGVVPRADDAITDAVYIGARQQATGGYLEFVSSTEAAASTAEDERVVITPVEHTEAFDGTGMHHRVRLEHYPYIDVERIYNLAQTLSSGASGSDEVALYDSNAESPLYLASGALTSATGYRPLRVTLNFQDGTIARPDSFGYPTPGDAMYVAHEMLMEVTDETLREDTTRRRFMEDIPGGTKTTTILDKLERGVPMTTHATRFYPIVEGPAGPVISLYWVLPSLTEGDVEAEGTPIPGDQVIVDPQVGKVIIHGNAPTSAYVPVAYYYYRVATTMPALSGEDQPVSGIHESFLGRPLPITRNATDYLNGGIPQMKPFNDDPLSLDYYPIYEYYQHPDGYLVLEQDLHRHGDTPAEVRVVYESLDINPRAILRAKRSGSCTMSPIVDCMAIYADVRRAPKDT